MYTGVSTANARSRHNVKIKCVIQYWIWSLNRQQWRKILERTTALVVNCSVGNPYGRALVEHSPSEVGNASAQDVVDVDIETLQSESGNNSSPITGGSR